MKYVVYTRVSSREQGKSGLGIDAQLRDIRIFLENLGAHFEVLGQFCDIQSGADDDRPQLASALNLARANGAELLISKLDRLSRKVSFIASLMDDRRLQLRVASMPSADKFQLHIYAALAEQEREFISRRTKAALAVAKSRGAKLGGLRTGTEARNAGIADKATQEALKLVGIVKPLRSAGETLTSIANTLDSIGMKTSRGGRWTATQVLRVLKRTN